MFRFLQSAEEIEQRDELELKRTGNNLDYSGSDVDDAATDVEDISKPTIQPIIETHNPNKNSNVNSVNE